MTTAGAAWVALPAVPPITPGPGDILAQWFTRYFAAMEAAYPVLLDQCATTRPDVVCYDATNWPALGTREDTGPVPSTVDVQPWFPQPAVLARARVFVTHAGMNSVMEALHAGVPVVAVPKTPEQEANADRIQELGLGERLPPGGDPRAAVERVAASADVRREVERMRAAVRACGGVALAADVVTAV